MEKEKFDHIEERLRAIEGGRDYAFTDMEELCLVPDVVIPLKFKVPDFDKYKGTTCWIKWPQNKRRGVELIIKEPLLIKNLSFLILPKVKKEEREEK